MAANVHYIRKMVADEIYDTLFFATGEIPTKERTKDYYILRVANFAEVKINSNKKIYVNGDFCRYPSEAKFVIQEMIR
jgi:hypothetical protein